MKHSYISTVFLLFVQVAQAQQPGDLDSTFAINGKLVLEEELGEVQEIASLDDGKMLLMVRAGTTTKVLRRYYDGSADTTFADNGILSWPNAAKRMLVDGEERIYLVGSNGFHGILRRFLPNGSLDLEYGVDGVPGISPNHIPFKDAAIYPNGRLIIAYDLSSDPMLPTGTHAGMFRLTEGGMLDTQFMQGGYLAFAGSSTSCGYTRNACPMVVLGPLGDIYLVRQLRIGDTCSPGHPFFSVMIHRYTNDETIPDVISVCSNNISWGGTVSSMVPGNDGKLSIVYINGSYYSSMCTSTDGTQCSPSLNMPVPGYGMIGYSLASGINPKSWFDLRKGLQTGQWLHGLES